jgi:hypothetical protein
MSNQHEKIFKDNWVPYHIVNFRNLKIDETVKINNGYEKFWVKIIILEDETEFVVGEVSSKLVNDLPYNYQDLVMFHTSNIMVHHTEEDIEKNVIEIQEKFTDYINQNYSDLDFSTIPNEKIEKIKEEFYQKNIIIKS